MNDNKKALTLALAALVALALAMVAYYYVEARRPTAVLDSNAIANGEAESIAGSGEDLSRFAGLYSPQDGALEADGKRLAFLSLSAEEGGGLTGFFKLDSIGAPEEFQVECSDVRFEAQEIFVKCGHVRLGNVSFNGTWAKADGIQLDGKVLWTRDDAVVLDQRRKFVRQPTN